KTIMNQKLDFICDWISGSYTITELCKAYQISRPTAYKYISRYENEGISGLKQRVRRHQNHPFKTDQNVVNEILRLKEKYKHWGAKKIKVLLLNSFSNNQIPSVTTVHAILKNNGLVRKQKRRRKIELINPIFDPKQCNEVWSADFKGKFKMGNTKYCCPLTIQDSKSRFVFAAKGMFKETFKDTKSEFTKVFRKYGIPKQIHTDNGTPFGSISSIARYSRLSYWFIDLGIQPVFSDPARPDQNGRHERMHRDLKAYCTKPPAYEMKAQQRLLNRFIKEYNNIRPHEALNMNTPSKIHSFSTKPFPERIPKYTYDTSLKIMRVTQNGSCRWNSYYWVFLSSSLANKYVAAQEIGNGIWKVFYRDVALGYFSEHDLRGKEARTRLTQNIV
ncbi:integrase core domain-containing protein, partial [Flavobacteriaceae bacterium]|nr:integrase core domain-containing protein [Flavobacteriaceae bacterium]